MKRTARTVLATFLAALALTAATAGVSLLPQPQTEPSTSAPVQLTQSTSAILEDRAA